MKTAKRKKLEEAGWKVGSTSEFLGLSEADDALISMKLALARNLKQRRKKKRLTQTQLARRLGSSQSRIAKMESADGSVSLELLVRSLLTLGASRSNIAAMIGSQARRITSKKSPKRKAKKRLTA